MNAQDVNQDSLSLLDKIKNFLSPDSLSHRFNITKGRLIEMGIYLLVGFILGYLLKRFNRLIFAVVICVAVLLLLNQLELINFSFNWLKIRELFGMQPSYDQTSLVTVYWEWAKNNVSLMICFIIGFLLGVRLA